MHEDRVPLEDSREPVFAPQASEGPVIGEPSWLGWKIAAVLCVMLAAIALGYGWLQRDAAQRLTSEREDLRDSLAQAKVREDALSAKINALSAAAAQEKMALAGGPSSQFQAEALNNPSVQPQDAGAVPENAPIHRSRPSSAVAHRAVRRRVAVDDPRWKQMQQQLTDQQKQLTDNQQQLAKENDLITKTQTDLETAKTDLNANLQSTRTQLGGDIARNHDELVALEKKGERNYYEFSFEKSKAFHHTGPISLALRKSDTKHAYCDLEMVVDDRTMSRKHVNLYESITLYPEGYRQPVEVIVNHIDKDSIGGYVSEPKYRPTQHNAATAEAVPVAPPPAAAVTTASAPPSTTTASASPNATSDLGLQHRADGSTAASR